MTGPQRYREKPVEVEVEAMQLTGPEDVVLIVDWITSNGGDAYGNTGRRVDGPSVSITRPSKVEVRADVDDFIIGGVNGWFTVMAPGEFGARYDEVTG